MAKLPAASPLLSRCRQVAADIKAAISLGNLHMLVVDRDDGTGDVVDLDFLSNRLSVQQRLQYGYGWDQRAEEQLALIVYEEMIAAEGRTLLAISTDALVKELKRRHDLFFMCGSPNTPEDYQWRRATKGAAHPLIGFITLHVNALVTEAAASAGAVDYAEIWDQDVKHRDDDDPAPA